MTIPTTSQSSVTQNGLTINFDASYPCGQFVSGDWFVVGSPTVTSTSPSWDGTLHGSQLNPTPTEVAQGLRATEGSNAFDYNSTLNAQLNLPLQLSPGDSFIHSRGMAAGEQPPDVPLVQGVPRPGLWDTIVLTVLAAAPPDGSFRPPYVPGYDKVVNEADINWSLLLTLTPPPSTPSWSTIEERATRLFCDWYGADQGRYLQAYNNSEWYGREISTNFTRAILATQLDFTQAQKQAVVYGTIQRAVDIWGIAAWIRDNDASNGFWGIWGGGLGHGRKTPVLYAGLLLGDQDLLDSVGNFTEFPQLNICWAENGQTYYVADLESESTVADWQHPTWGWGERAWWDPGNQSGGIPGNHEGYMLPTAAELSAATLIVRLMQAQSDWNHDSALDWAEWMIEVETDGSVSANGPFITQFHKDMWDTYSDWEPEGSHSGPGLAAGVLLTPGLGVGVPVEEHSGSGEPAGVTLYPGLGVAAPTVSHALRIRALSGPRT